MPAREANEVVGVSRKTEVSEPSGAAVGAATILPGVPLPQWVLPPAAPTPPPPPPPPPPPMAAPVPAVIDMTAPVVTVAPPRAPAEALEPPTAHEHRDLVEATPAPVLEPTADLTPAALGYELPVTAASAAPAFAFAAPVEAAIESPPIPWSETVADAPVQSWGEPLGSPATLATLDVPVLVPDDDASTPGSHSKTETSDSDPESGRSRRPLVLLLVLGVVAILAAVAAFVWPGLLITPETTTAAPSGSVSPAPVARGVTLVTPDSIDGLDRVPGTPDAALKAAAGATKLNGFSAPVSAVYAAKGIPAANVVAWSGPSTSPATSVSTAFAGFQTAASTAVTSIIDVKTGSLGGLMSCGTSVLGSLPATVCFWADDVSFGAVTVLRPESPQRGADIAASLRVGVETLS